MVEGENGNGKKCKKGQRRIGQPGKWAVENRATEERATGKLGNENNFSFFIYIRQKHKLASAREFSSKPPTNGIFWKILNSCPNVLYSLFPACLCTHTVSQKVEHQLTAITLSKPNRFSKFFHRWKETSKL